MSRDPINLNPNTWKQERTSTIIGAGYCPRLKKSARSGLKITDVIQSYINISAPRLKNLGRGMAQVDTRINEAIKLLILYKSVIDFT